jgi:hypothetical protein
MVVSTDLQFEVISIPLSTEYKKNLWEGNLYFNILLCGIL